MSPGQKGIPWVVRVAGALSVALCARLVGADAPAPQKQGLTAEEVATRLEKAGKDPVDLAELIPQVGARAAARIREQVKALLADRKQIAGPEELEVLTRRLGRVLPAAARSPAEVRELLGPPKQILRQVLYRRYLEQWHYDTPLTLCVVLHAAKGQELRVQTVLLPRAVEP